MKTEAAAEFFGSKKKLAEALGITPSAVTMWGEDVPELRQYQIERLTRGKVKSETATVSTAPQAPTPVQAPSAHSKNDEAPAERRRHRGRRATDLDPEQALQVKAEAEALASGIATLVRHVPLPLR